MGPQLNRNRLWIVGGIVLVVMVALVAGIAAIYNSLHKPSYSQGVAITNYDKKIKNLPDDRKQSIEAALSNTIKLNLPNGTAMPNIDDATIRDGSEQQTELVKNTRYKGSFIVDIASIKQSYRVQYAYSSDPNDSFAIGYPVNVTCLSINELKYGDFQCKSVVSEESKGIDPIISQLPHTTLSYNLRASTTSGSLILYADLDIASVDLKGDLASKQRAVALYKKEVTDWIAQQGLDPSKYTIKYNYDDNGNLTTP